MTRESRLKIRFSFLFFLAWLGFYLYSNLRDIYTWLPPMLGFLFALYRHALVQEKSSTYLLIWVFTCLLCVELIHTQPLGILILLFVLYEKLVVQYLLRVFQDNIFGDFVHAFLVYLIYFVILSFLYGYYSDMWDNALQYSVLEFLLWRIYART
ncbi:hypothetical protein [Helicobacter cynogastricus]|uniref:hypothetical protein n=1 Tax=Helicobacter cynogastricus TaxID=329937 RepID=UPI000CF13DE8|nr:hypothetical protein [Helicobacter cynogastricus]